MTTVPLAVELVVTPGQLTAANRDSLMITATVKNLGATLIDPQLNLSELKVNRTVSKDWNLALGNSGHPKKWRALPPGESVSGSYAKMFELFPKPGDYTLVLVVSGVASAPVAIHVSG